jgi:hypothetical protein
MAISKHCTSGAATVLSSSRYRARSRLLPLAGSGSKRNQGLQLGDNLASGMLRVLAQLVGIADEIV